MASADPKAPVTYTSSSKTWRPCRKQAAATTARATTTPNKTRERRGDDTDPLNARHPAADSSLLFITRDIRTN